MPASLQSEVLFQSAVGYNRHTYAILHLLLFLLIYLFILAALDLYCFALAFSSCLKWGLLFVVACGLLIAVASLVAEPAL